MAMADLNDWIDAFGRPGAIWFVKRLSANDTQATGGHQAGSLVPKDTAFLLFPALNRPQEKNPRESFML